MSLFGRLPMLPVACAACAIVVLGTVSVGQARAADDDGVPVVETDVDGTRSEDVASDLPVDSGDGIVGEHDLEKGDSLTGHEDGGEPSVEDQPTIGEPDDGAGTSEPGDGGTETTPGVAIDGETTEGDHEDEPRDTDEDHRSTEPPPDMDYGALIARDVGPVSGDGALIARDIGPVGGDNEPRDTDEDHRSTEPPPDIDYGALIARDVGPVSGDNEPRDTDEDHRSTEPPPDMDYGALIARDVGPVSEDNELPPEPDADPTVVLPGTVARRAERVTRILDRTAGQIAVLNDPLGGLDFVSEKVATIQALQADARAALAAGAVDFADALVHRIDTLVGALREEGAAHRAILDASDDLADTLDVAGASGRDLPEDVVTMVTDLLARAADAASAGDFHTAEDLRDRSEELIDSARDAADIDVDVDARVSERIERAREELARLVSELGAAGAPQPLKTAADVEALLAEAEGALAGATPEAALDVLNGLSSLMAAARGELLAAIALHDATEDRENTAADGVALPEPRNAEIDDLLAQADAAAAEGNFDDAVDFAERARELLGDSQDEILGLARALELAQDRVGRLVDALGNSTDADVAAALDRAQSLVTDAQAALDGGATDDGASALAAVDDIVDDLRDAVDARSDMDRAGRQLEVALAIALDSGIELPPDAVAELHDLLAEAEQARSDGDFAAAELLAEQAEDLLDGLREGVEDLRESVRDLADDVREVATQIDGSAAQVEDLLAAAGDLRSSDSLALVQEALLAAAEAARDADRVAERARRASERADEDGSDESGDVASDADDIADNAIGTALAAARSVSETAARLAETTRLAADAARSAFDTGHVDSRRGAESTLDEDLLALRRASEAIDLVVQNAQRAAENASRRGEDARQRADATGDPDHVARAEAAAQAAIAAAQALADARRDAATSAAAAAEATADVRALLADTDALEAEGHAAQAARGTAREAQTLARDAASVLRNARARAEEAAEQAAQAEAQGETSDDEDVRAAAERARAAAARAAEAAQRAEDAARRAGREATDVDDDGVNNIRDLILVARSFGAAADGAEVPIDIDGDGRVTILDIVLTAQGLGDGAILPVDDSNVAAAPGASIGRLIARTRALPDGVVELELSAADPIEAVGVEFDVRLASRGMVFVESRSKRPDAFEIEPIVADDSIRGGYVLLGDLAPSSDDVLARVALRALVEGVWIEAPRLSARVTVVEASGRLRRLVLGSTDVAYAPPPLPVRTTLRQNFPNPFNPETWIPYELPSAADVRIAIYDSMGRHVRTLDLGRQVPGAYVVRSRAAYWDGRNDTGEPAASGVYFYRLEADDYSETRRLVIRK